MYIPNLKTSDSEIRAVRFLDQSTKKEILPAFELTRSRKTSRLPHGSVHLRMEQLLEAYGGDNFIVDLSTEEDLINEEIYSFFDQSNGYARWVDFVSNFRKRDLTPCLIYEEGGDKQNFQRQILALRELSQKVALRLSAADENAQKLYTWALERLDQSEIIVIGSLYFVGAGEASRYVSLGREFISSVVGNRPPNLLAIPMSSFPRSVVESGYGEDSEGSFDSLEHGVFSGLKQSYPVMPLCFSDYASVHPIRYPTRGGAWVPRVDLPLGDHLEYRRYRRDDGGYAKAAKELYVKHGSKLINCWGADQIRAAANGAPNGASPSYWISVRINYWVTAVAQRYS